MGAEKFRFEETRIKGLQVIHSLAAYDERGFNMKTFEQNIFQEHGIELGNAEDMISYSRKGVLRGVHFQTKYSQDKLIRVLKGEVWDVAVDLRKGSETYGKWQSFCLSDENKLSVYIPQGFAHGFLVLSEDALFSYRFGQGYYPDYDSGIRWNDESLNIAWPLDRVEDVIISEKDKKLQTFAEFEKIYGGLV
jgi:dTDP-4-dehydrorhamnose 3,5-epimerase